MWSSRDSVSVAFKNLLSLAIIANCSTTSRVAIMMRKHAARAKDKYAHNHVTAESAQPRSVPDRVGLKGERETRKLEIRKWEMRKHHCVRLDRWCAC